VLFITNASETDEGAYYCYVTTYGGGWSGSESFYLYAGSLTVNPPVSIGQQPVSQVAVCQGEAVTATLAASNATSYQWYKDAPNTSNPVDGQTAASLQLGNVQPAQSGTYYCYVVGPCGGVWSDGFTLTVNPAPTATLMGTTTVCQNATAPGVVFTGASGKAPYTFTYTFNGSTQTVTTTSGNAVEVVQPTGSAGTFTYSLLSVTDANSCSKTIDAQTAVVTVQPVTSIRSLTPSQSICGGQPFTVSVQAEGQNLAYQWYRKVGSNLNQAIPGATTATATIPASYLPGTFYVAVSGSCGAVDSEVFLLSNKPPTLLQVSSLVSSVCEGGSLTLSVRGSGPAPLTYAWRRDDANGPVVGTGTSLTIQNAQVADAGSYVCTLTSECATAQVSIPVTVRYVRITTQPQSVNLCSGQTTLSVGVQAVGLTPTYQWKRNGQNIAGATQPSYTVSAAKPGTYTVDVKTSCATLTSQGATVGCSNGRLAAEPADSEYLGRLVVAPNPVSGQEIRCRVWGLETPEFTLITATGSALGVTSRSETDGAYLLRPTQRLPPGVYILQASEGNTRLTQRVLVAE
jgi:hypothetical protein